METKNVLTKGVTEQVQKEDITTEELESIYNYTRSRIDKQKLYTFNVVLCDNDIDRDVESFSKKALDELAVLFVGKTGIFDHSMKSHDQSARIFETTVKNVEGKKTKDGRDYFQLVAKAYMLKNDKTANLIDEIEAGIKKEVSIGCRVLNKTCSICGKDVRDTNCNHQKGKSYNGNIAYSILDQVVDGYEWSFVAVPAQQEAGVTKGFNFLKNDTNENLTDIVKMLSGVSEEIIINKEQAKAITNYIDDCKKMAQFGQEYLVNLRKEAIALCDKSVLEFETPIVSEMVQMMDVKQLKSFITTLKGGKQTFNIQTLPDPIVESESKQKAENLSANNQFLI